jgi:hypothetical protein
MMALPLLSIGPQHSRRMISAWFAVVEAEIVDAL